MEKIILRDYQEEALKGIREKFKKCKRVVLVLPTGAGKTVTFAAMVKRTVERKPDSVIFIMTHRTELSKQGAETLKKFGIEPFKVTSKTRKGAGYADKNVFVCMVESLKSRKDYLPKPDLIIIDEAHIGNFKKVSQWYPDTYQVLCTATPVNSNRKTPMKTYADNIYVGPQVHDLILKGMLAKVKVYGVALDMSKLEKDNKGEFTEKSQSAVFDKAEVYEGLTENLKHHGGDKKTLVFCSSISHVENTTQELINAGFEAKCLHSQQTEEDEKRDDVLEWFAKTPASYLVNCGILTAGFDEPTIERVILLRATTSTPLFMQMVGRGARITKDKDTFELFDFGGNWERLGGWDEPRAWEYVFFNPPKAGEGVPPMKNCPNAECGAMIPAPVMVCPECGHIMESKKKEEPPKKVILGLLDRGVSEEAALKIWDDSRQYASLSEGKKAALYEKSREIFSKNGLEGLKAFGKFNGFKQGWAFARAKQLELSQTDEIKGKAKYHKDFDILQEIYDEYGMNGLEAIGEANGFKPGWAFVQKSKLEESNQLF